MANNATPAPAPPSSAAEVTAVVTRAFSGVRFSHKPAARYRLMLALVAAAVMLLPVIYSALVLAVGLASLWYLLKFWILAILMPPVGLLLYFMPPLAGLAIVANYLNPLLSSRRTGPVKTQITRENEPVFFAFIDQLCIAIGAPAPARVIVNCDVNASAGFRRGWRSFLDGTDLELCIGLPLVTGMPLDHLAGVIAHELGHFSQDAGLRLSYVIRRVDQWLSNAVYGNTGLWELSGTRAMNRNIAGWFFSLPISLPLKLIHGVLWVLMRIGQIISSRMLHEMKFDADRYETFVVGSDRAADSQERIERLALAARRAQAALLESIREGRVCDDLPGYITFHSHKMSAADNDAIARKLGERKNAPFATHPANALRIGRAVSHGLAGVLRSDLPAACLFRNLGSLCKSATFSLFASLPNLPSTLELVPTDSLIKKDETIEQTDPRLAAFLGIPASKLRPLTIKTVDSPDAATRDALAASRQAMLALAPAARTAYDAIASTNSRIADAAMITLFLRIGIEPVGEFAQLRDRAACRAVIDSESKNKAKAIAGVAAFEDAARTRLASALSLLSDTAIAAQIPDAPLKIARTQTLLKALAAVGPCAGPINDLETENQIYAGINQALAQTEINVVHNAVLVEYRSGLCDQLVHVRSLLLRTPYPFETASKTPTIGGVVMEAFISKKNPLSSLHAVSLAAVERVRTLHARILNELVETATAVEAVVDAAEKNKPAT